MQVVLRNKPSERERWIATLREVCREHDVAAEVVQSVDLALEELLTNVFQYAYDDPRDRAVVVRLEFEPEHLVIELTDEGKPFNPLSAPRADISLPLDKRPIGGLGIHLVRHCMDELEYRRHEGKNVLWMRKRLRPERSQTGPPEG